VKARHESRKSRTNPTAGFSSTWRLKMRDILDFKVMVTPLIAKGVYLLLSAFVIVLSLIQMFKGSFWNGIVMLCLGLLVVRIFFEWLILFFRMHEALQSIDRKLGSQPQPPAAP
jgi:hypothetical protein